MRRGLRFLPPAIAIAGALILALMSAAVAQEVVGPRGLTARQIVGNLDRDGDRRISRDEFRGPPQRFSAIDGDDDGFLTAAELEAFWRSQAQSPAPAAGSANRPWIDVHAHAVAGSLGEEVYRALMRAVAGVMEPAGITTMILMPPPQPAGRAMLVRAENLAPAVQAYPGRLAYLGGGGSLNPMLQEAGEQRTVDAALRQRFEERAERILADGAIGFGEIAIHHLSMVEGHAYESVPADHPLLLLLADIAARHKVVIDLHLDLVVEDMATPAWLTSPANPRRLKANLAGFERLLAHNRGARIVWAHAGSDNIGQWTVQLSRALLARHPNLFMSLRMTPGRVPANHPLGPGGITQAWLSLLADYPDRFVIGGDQFFVPPEAAAGRGGSGGPARIFAQWAEGVRQRTRAFLARLPDDLAHRIGYENARRLYGLDR